MKENLKEQIIKQLKTCYDPEIPLDLWSLGLIYNIAIDNKKSKKNINITMSLTTPGCSMGQHMADDIKTKVMKLKQVQNVNVELTFDPPWNPEMMTIEAREKLGFGSVKKSVEKQKNNVEWE